MLTEEKAFAIGMSTDLFYEDANADFYSVHNRLCLQGIQYPGSLQGQLEPPPYADQIRENLGAKGLAKAPVTSP